MTNPGCPWIWDSGRPGNRCHPPLSSHSPCVPALLMLSWCVHIKERHAPLLSQQWGGQELRLPQKTSQTIHLCIIYAAAVKAHYFYLQTRSLTFWCGWLTPTNTRTHTLRNTLTPFKTWKLAFMHVHGHPQTVLTHRLRYFDTNNSVKCTLTHSDTQTDAHTHSLTPSHAILQHTVMLHPLLWMSVLAWKFDLSS